MSQSKEEYLAGYRRLAPFLPDRARVVTPSGLGKLVSLDLDQDDGYGVGVRVDYIEGRGHHVLSKYLAGSVLAFADFKEALIQLYEGVTWDGGLVCKSHRDTLVGLKLAAKYDGFNFITAKGIEELVKNEWIGKDGAVRY